MTSPTLSVTITAADGATEVLTVPYPTFVVGAESPAGTTVTTVGPTINASPTPGTAGSGNVLAITSGGQISLNGVVTSPYSITSGVVELYYTNHTAYQLNNAGLWFGPMTTTSCGTQVANPTTGSAFVSGAGHQLYDNFWQDTNGTNLNGHTMPTGQTWVESGQISAVISNVFGPNMYVAPHSGTGGEAAYLFGPLGVDVGYMEAQFEFFPSAAGSSNTTSTGVCALIVWQTTNITASPCHCVFLPNQYQYSVMPAAGGFNTIQTVSYAGNINLQYVKILFDKTNSIAHVTGADGVTTAISDPNIGSVHGDYAVCEISYTAPATDIQLGVLEFAADAVGTVAGAALPYTLPHTF